MDRKKLVIELVLILGTLGGAILNPVIIWRLGVIEEHVKAATVTDYNVALLCDAHPELRCVERRQARLEASHAEAPVRSR